jgi:Cys-tRNA(Pro) deacylase
MPETSGRARALEAARARGLSVEPVQLPRVRSLEEAAAGLGVEPRDVVKTLVVKRADDDFLLVLVPGDRQLAWPRLRALVGANRLQLPDAEVALAATGYARGTITPLGAQGEWPLVADASVVGRRISLGAGEPGWSVWVDADDLLRAYDATVADVTG